jgi:hypothetical protein
MTKLTQEEVSATKIIRATFDSGLWNVLVSDENSIIYSVRFEGSEDDTNEVILRNTHSELLNTDKIEVPVIPTPVTREDIVGETPKL